MFTADDILKLQQEQFRHDKRNHFEILALHKTDRLKHYGLHFAKYAGRLARGTREMKALDQTLTDAALVALSAANALHQRLGEIIIADRFPEVELEALSELTDAAGRFCDACEKVDHVEEFIEMARTANADILRWVIRQSDAIDLDLLLSIDRRRAELAKRQFFVAD